MMRTVAALMLREIATRYGRSPGGYLWEIAEPVAAITLLSIVFSTTGMRPTQGKSFALFYATGFLPFFLYQDLANMVSRAIAFSRPFLQYPVVSYIDVILARALLNVLTQVTVFIIVLGGINVLFQLNILWDFPALILGLAMTASLGIGVGVINCYLFIEVPVWERAWSILTRPLFLISGVFFTYAMMPPSAQKILWFNPLIHGVGMTRKAVYPSYDDSYVSPLFVFSVAIILTFLGLLMLWRHHSRLLES